MPTIMELPDGSIDIECCGGPYDGHRARIVENTLSFQTGDGRSHVYENAQVETSLGYKKFQYKGLKSEW